MTNAPQLENGHIKIANELYDAILQFDLSKRELKVILFILRKTYGYNKKEDKISFSQIAKGTGLYRPHIISTVKSLKAKNIIKTSDQNSTSYVNIYCINKLYKTWIPSTKTVPQYQNGTPPVPKQLPKLVTKTVPTKDNKDKDTPPISPKKEKKPIEDINHHAKQILAIWNKKFGTDLTSTHGFEKNLAYWLDEYDMEKIEKAIGNISQDEYWLIHPQTLFRKGNPRFEDVDYIGLLLAKSHTKKEKHYEIFPGWKREISDDEWAEIQARSKAFDEREKQNPQPSLAQQWREKKKGMNGLTKN